jgi:RNA polymerase sigma factor (sigma-70 family)
MSNLCDKSEGQIYEENKGLINNVIAILFTNDEIRHLGKDDLFQEGSIGLLKAIRSFDKNKAVEFSTYATICIRNEMRNYAMKNKFGGTRVGKRSQYNAIKQGNEAAEEFVWKHSVSVCGQSDFPDGFSDICGRTYNPSAEEEAIVNLWIEESVKKLPSDLYKNCVREYLDILSARETAKKLGVSEASVSRALSAFRELLTESENGL